MGVLRKGKLEFVEKGKSNKKVLYFDLTQEAEAELEFYVQEGNEISLMITPLIGKNGKIAQIVSTVPPYSKH